MAAPDAIPPAPHANSVLVVEDDRALREVVVTILRIKKFEVYAAATVAEGLELLNRHHPEYLILDLNLPDGCGTTILEEVRRLNLGTKVAVASGTTDRALMDRAAALGPDEVIRKPFRASDLTRWLRRWLEDEAQDEANFPPAPRARAGVTMVEAIISTVIVAVMLTVALQTVAAARAGDFKSTANSRGQFLAQALLSEILNQAYVEPTSTPAFGPESGETRATFDDVDDYSDYAEPSPCDKSGVALSNCTGWRRSVKVEYVSVSSLNGPAATSDTGIKRVTVTVSYKNTPVTALTAFATSAP